MIADRHTESLSNQCRRCPAEKAATPRWAPSIERARWQTTLAPMTTTAKPAAASSSGGEIAAHLPA
jgi:hypothetical protein